jgi:hypothetical protein
MTAKSSTKRKTTPGKTAATERKSAAGKPVPARAAKKGKKDRKEGGRVETKVKVVRDSFTMPQNDYARIAELKQVCLKAGMHVKKSELLRAGLHALGKMSAAQLKQTIARVEQIKTGRPKKAA